MSKVLSTLRPQSPPEPTEPAPTPASPTTGSSRSRSVDPITPLAAADSISYGSTVPMQEGTVPAIKPDNVPARSQNVAKRRTYAVDLWTFLNSRYSPYLLLENSGSVARDHLASERTYLAYVRTSLALAAAGVALVQLLSVSSLSHSSDRLENNLLRFARPLGASSIAVGIFVLGIGTFRYFRVQATLISGGFPLARLSIVFISSIIALLVAVIFAVLIQATQ